MQKTLRTNFASYSAEDEMDPALLDFVQQYFILDNMMIKLVGIGDQDEYTNELADKIEFSENNKTITVTLKKRKFSDGTLITAEDVAKSLKRAAILGSPHTNIEDLWLGSSNLKSINDEISGITVLGDYKLILRLTREAKEIFYFLSMADLGVLHKSQYTKNRLQVTDWTKVSSGPYVGQVDSNNKIQLIANPHYESSNPSRPGKVVFNNLHGKKIIPEIKSKNIDLGFLTFNDYLENDSLLSSLGYVVLGEKYDALTMITLNASSKKFADPKVRRKFLKAIEAGFKLGSATKKAAAKASQFFLPDAVGFVNRARVKKKIESLSAGNTDLKAVLGDEFIIEGIKGMRFYLPPDLESRLSDALGVNVKVRLNTENNDGKKKYGIDRAYDAQIIAYGMSKKVLGEALNLQYLSKNPPLLDPTGKIKQLLQEYQQKDDNKSENVYIGKIIMQMIEDAELVPLFYFSSPFVVNPSTIQSTKLNLRESPKFHKIRMK